MVAIPAAASASSVLLADDFEGARNIVIATPSGALQGWFWPAIAVSQDPAPAVVLLHGCSGVFGSNGYGDESHLSSRFQAWAHRLNAAGIHALLLDSFSTRDPQHAPAQARQNYCNDRAAVVAIGATEEVDRPRDAIAAYDALLHLAGARVDPARVAVMGWSHGGSAALATAAIDAATQPFVLAQGFYPGCGLYGAFGNAAANQSTYVATIPLDLYIGSEDSISIAATCAAHIGHSDAADGAIATWHTFDGVGHSFDGAACEERDNGALLSPWSGKRYTCTGAYDGVPFDLYDYRAALESRELALCALLDRFGMHEAACDAPPAPP